MIEIRFHGRGGQGAVFASNILANAAFREGNDVQAFPYFGVERRGAPVTAFVRMDDKPVRIKSQIYEPDYVVVLDSSLLSAVNVTDGLKKEGLVLINTKRMPEELKKLGEFRIATVDATSIALKYRLGSRAAPIVNTSILGGVVKAAGIVKLETIKKSILEIVPVKKEENAEAAVEAFNNTHILNGGN